ncbi:uncharacterized protein MONBRDRAFT_38343 [Monosiga brevicollis MX1]|uniref:MYND-type domain-containing protein n=1 Tax=Monosiga brevicollis TaxID=81824 RepID=A9V747_MONBE|nr:uncharacterized protein MONBRDRAFT_38343 [Monosiga brevicollis MX1]EDQ86728.1 predicted protein [Monosiga brevicollis MX1]|eukprot:XP_001748564.1 hypothetical protein [Monosiga brevicollis MX1]
MADAAATKKRNSSSGPATTAAKRTKAEPLDGRRSSNTGSPYNGVANQQTSAPTISPSQCSVCMKPASYLCSKCCQAWYCGRDCQKNHWSVHRQDCSDERRWQVAQQANIQYSPMPTKPSTVPTVGSTVARPVPNTAMPSTMVGTPYRTATYMAPSTSRYYAPATSYPSGAMPRGVASKPMGPVTSVPTAGQLRTVGTVQSPAGTMAPGTAGMPVMSSAPTVGAPGKGPMMSAMSTSTAMATSNSPQVSNAATGARPAPGTSKVIPPCHVCRKEATCKCSLCGNEYYCSRDCQVKAWNTHRNSCRRTSSVATTATVATSGAYGTVTSTGYTTNRTMPVTQSPYTRMMPASTGPYARTPYTTTTRGLVNGVQATPSGVTTSARGGPVSYVPTVYSSMSAMPATMRPGPTVVTSTVATPTVSTPTMATATMSNPTVSTTPVVSTPTVSTPTASAVPTNPVATVSTPGVVGAPTVSVPASATNSTATAPASVATSYPSQTAAKP